MDGSCLENAGYTPCTRAQGVSDLPPQGDRLIAPLPRPTRQTPCADKAQALFGDNASAPCMRGNRLMLSKAFGHRRLCKKPFGNRGDDRGHQPFALLARLDHPHQTLHCNASQLSQSSSSISSSSTLRLVTEAQPNLGSAPLPSFPRSSRRLRLFKCRTQLHVVLASKKHA
jgi:hypothetical protein